MSLYLAFWGAGAVLGLGAAAWVLQRRRALDRTSLCGLGLVVLTFLYAAKVQHRLVYMPFVDAFLVSPADLLGPGRRLPLALMMSLAVGILWCRAWGKNWRAMGDALAIAGPVLQGVGRWGCFLSGCCTGIVSQLPWAVSFGPQSDAHMLHASMGWIPEDALVSLPVHPLPIYFSLVGLALAAIMIWMVRRETFTGSLLVLALMVGPPVRLALEHLRGGLPWRDWTPMLRTLEVWIVLDLIVLAVWGLAVARRRRQAGESGSLPIATLPTR